MARCALLSAATLLPAIVQHEHTARSGHVKADAIALLLAFLRSSKVTLQTVRQLMQSCNLCPLARPVQGHDHTCMLLMLQ